MANHVYQTYHSITTDKIADGTINQQNIADNSVDVNQLTGQYQTGGLLPGTHQHTLGPNQYFPTPGTYNPGIDPYMAPVPGLLELVKMLDIDQGGPPPLLTAEDGSRYSLVHLLKAQVEFMARLNVLLVHRNPRSEEE